MGFQLARSYTSANSSSADPTAGMETYPDSHVAKWGETVLQFGESCGAHATCALMESRMRYLHMGAMKLSEKELVALTDPLEKERDYDGVAPLHVNVYFKHLKSVGVGLNERWNDAHRQVSYPRFGIDSGEKLKWDSTENKDLTVLKELAGGRPVIGVMKVDENFRDVSKGEIYDNDASAVSPVRRRRVPPPQHVRWPTVHLRRGPPRVPPTEQFVRLHAILVVGIIGDDTVVIKNWYGSNWGDKGYYKVSRRTFLGFYTITNITVETAPPRPQWKDFVRPTTDKIEVANLFDLRNQYDGAVLMYDHLMRITTLGSAERLVFNRKRSVCFFRLFKMVSIGTIEDEGDRLLEEGKYPDAMKEYSDAIKRANGLPFCYEIRSRCHRGRAICYTKMGNDEACLSELTMSLHFDPTYARALTDRADLYVKLRNFAAANADMDTFLKLDLEIK